MSTIFDMVAGEWLRQQDQVGGTLLEFGYVPHNEIPVARLADRAQATVSVYSMPADLANVRVDDFLNRQSALSE